MEGARSPSKTTTRQIQERKGTHTVSTFAILECLLRALNKGPLSQPHKQGLHSVKSRLWETLQLASTMLQLQGMS